MFRRSMLAAAGLVAVCASAPCGAAAQAPRELRVGETVHGTLTPADPALRDRGRFQVFRVQIADGQRLVATLRSGAFDALLTLLRPVGGITEELASDDDSGGGTDARLRFSAPEPGGYLLVAQSLDAEGLGGFTLSLEEAPPPRPATPQPIRNGETRTGRLAEDGPLLYEDDQDILYQLYVFDARAGQDLVVRLESADFDAYLAFGRLIGDALDITMRDDDGGGETHARVRVTIPADGRYGFHVRPLHGGVSGAYTVTLREAASPPASPLPAGGEIGGALGGDEAGADNRFSQQWIYRGAAGERVSIRMRSDEFDTLLLLGRVADGEFEELAASDDAADDGSNSHIEYTLPANGDYVIRATSFETAATGRYTLRLDVTR